LQRGSILSSSTGNPLVRLHFPARFSSKHNEWQVADKPYLLETTLALLNPHDKPVQNIVSSAAVTAY
jgi:hypothetical protein